MPLEPLNIIEKSIELKTDTQTIWRAIMDYQRFKEWFDVKLDGPFMIRRTNSGNLLCMDKKEKVYFDVQNIIFEEYFSYKWDPSCLDPKSTYTKSDKTLVEFTLKKLPHKVLFTIRESGFEHFSEEYREVAYKTSECWWSDKIKNLEQYIFRGKK
jgi:hypothetical protein